MGIMGELFPIPAKWKKYEVNRYIWHPTTLKIFHCIFIVAVLCAFGLFMIYFSALTTDQVVEIGVDDLSQTNFDSGWTCVSIGSRSNDQYNFASSIADHNLSLLNNSRYSIEFLNWNSQPDSTIYADDYIFWREYVYYNSADNSPLNTGDYDVTMNYSIDRGHADTLDKCSTMLQQEICNDSSHLNSIENQTYFFYNIDITFNFSFYADEIIQIYNQWDYDSIQLTLYFHNSETEADEKIGDLSPYPWIENLNWTQKVPFHNANDFWWYAAREGGIIDSVWSICEKKFVENNNLSLFVANPYWMSHPDDFNASFAVNINLSDHSGILQCSYDDPLYGQIITDIQDTNKQNDIIPTPMNEAGILVRLSNDIMDYSDTLSTVADGQSVDIRMNDKRNTILNTSEVIQIWNEEICNAMVVEYCKYVEVPPYYCTKYEYKSLFEAFSLSQSPTSLTYSILVILFAYCTKFCQCILGEKMKSNNENNTEMHLLRQENDSNREYEQRMQDLEKKLEEVSKQLFELKNPTNIRYK